MNTLTREQIEAIRNALNKYMNGFILTATDIGLDGSPVADRLCDMALRSEPAPEAGALVKQLNAIANGDLPSFGHIVSVCAKAAAALSARRVSEEALAVAKGLLGMSSRGAKITPEESIMARELLRLAGGEHGR